MKKYKLIKEYPGSPKLNTIIIHENNGWIDPYPSVEHDQMILIDWVIKYPNYWEEIIEKDYEILSYIENALEHRFSIKSIKRLSDGEIFTIGDKTNHLDISRFEICNIGIRVYFGTGSVHHNVNLNSLKHVKQPLFTTEDGVDIFENTNFVWILTMIDTSIAWKINKANSSTKYYFGSMHKIFSTEEKAQEYVDLNKPKYSLNDILSVAKDYYVMPQSFIDKLKQLNK